MSDRAPQGPARPGSKAEAQLALRADPRTNTVVKVVLRAGLATSLALLAVGLVIELAGGHHVANGVRMFHLLAPRTLGERVMAGGVLALTLTPAAGVLSVVVSWVRERDARFVGVGVVVVAVLTAAVVVGLG